MADSKITEFLDKIKTAIYGKDVRSAIHDAIKQCYDDGKAGAIDLQARESCENLEESKATKKEVEVERERIDQFVKLPEGSTTGDAELTDIRVASNGRTYGTAGGAVRGQVGGLIEKTDAINSAIYSAGDASTPATSATGWHLKDGGIANDSQSKQVSVYRVFENMYVKTKYGYQFRRDADGDSAISTFLGACDGVIQAVDGARFLAVEMDVEDADSYGVFEAVNELEKVKESQLKLDANLEEEGKAADAKAVGEAVGSLKEDLIKHDIPIGELKTGYFIDKLTGYEMTSSSYKCTDYINVSAYTELELQSIMGEDKSSISFYDNNKIFITGYNLFKPEGPYVHTVHKPSNAKYVRVTYNVSQNVINSPYLKAVEYINSVNDTILRCTDWIEANCTVKTGKFVHKNDGIIYDASDTVVGILDARDIKKIYIHNLYLAGDRCICGYDASNDFVESIDSGYSYNNSVFDKEYDIEKYSYIAFCAKNDFTIKVLPNGTVANADFSAIKNVKNHIILPKHDKLHVYYEFKFGDIALPTDSSNTQVELFDAYNGIVKFVTLHKKMTLVESYITAPVTAAILNKNIAYNSDQIVYMGNKWTNHIRGNNAFSIRCTDTSKQDITMTIGADGVVFASGGTIIDRVECDAGTTINTLINELKKISYLDVILIESVNHKYKDLLADASASIPMFYEFKKLDNSTYIDNPYISIPYKADKTWHSIELMIDHTSKKTYFAFDGLTCMSDISDIDITDYTMMIGKDVTNIRNIVIDVDTFADCEIVESESPPYGKRVQLISNHNPRLLIYEGHGISVRSDNSAPVEDSMEVSTDRLRTVIEYLNEHKYVPVSFHDIVEWKLGNKMLPKRCYNMMFDDWRLCNYIDYNKRLPFASANLCAGLAIVSSLKNRNDTQDIDGIAYNVGDMVDIIMRAGWYPCSHTYNHAELLNRKVSEVDAILADDVRSAESLGIYSDVLVYPQGSYEIRYRAPMENSAFKLGVNIVTDNYNCRGLSDYSLTRVEIGTRETLTNVLKPIV